jgi:hypothetical protein
MIPVKIFIKKKQGGLTDKEHGTKDGFTPKPVQRPTGQREKINNKTW